jgi:hypothetical protein
VPVICQKIVRRQRVEAALKGAATSNGALQAAMVDFEVITGSRYGKLTERLDRFLRELESSGVVVALAEEAVAERGETLSWRPFLELHNVVFGAAEDDARELYDSLRASFKASLELLYGDPALAVLLKAATGEIIRRLDRIEEGTRSNATPARPQSLSEVPDTLQRVSKALSSKFRDVRVETNKGAKLLPIDKIYIPTRLRARAGTQLVKEIIAADGGSKKARDRFLEVQVSNGGISYNEFRVSFRRAVILGDPGGGKSTISQYLCYQLAKQYSLVAQYSLKKTTELQPQITKIPVHVVLRSFESARLRTPQLSLFDYIVNDLHAIPGLTTSKIEDALLVALSCGQAIIAFDGLDEILNTGTRREYVELVTAFCDEFPYCPVFITSREVGYDDAPLPDDFEIFTLEKFSQDEIKGYVTKFLRVFNAYSDEKATEGADLFMAQTQREASDLRENPLMLGLMTYIFASKWDVPTNRPEIYRECAQLMFEKWDQNRNIKADIPMDFDMLSLFGLIASNIYGDVELEGGVDKEWINKQTKTFFLDVYENKSKAFEAAKKVTAFITGRSWVMSEFGAQKFRFSHRTFMEYFFARNLEIQCESVDDLLSAVIPHILEKQWDVISHLALQIKTFRNSRRTTHAIDLLCHRLEGNQDTLEHDVALSSFFANSLRYMVPSELECKLAVNSVASAVLRVARSGQILPATATIRGLTSAVADRRDYILQCLRDRIVREINSKSAFDDADVSFCAMLASGGVRTSFLRRLSDALPQDVGRAIRALLHGDMRKRARSDVFAAHVFFDWYREDFDALLDIHGPRLLTSDHRPWTTERISLPAIVFEIINSVSGLFTVLEFTPKDDAISILEAIGRRENVESEMTSANLASSDNRSVPLAFWAMPISKMRDRPYALKALLLLYRMYNSPPRSASLDGIDDAASAAVSQTQSDQFYSVFRAAVRKLKSSDQPVLAGFM